MSRYKQLFPWSATHILRYQGADVEVMKRGDELIQESEHSIDLPNDWSLDASGNILYRGQLCPSATLRDA